MFSSGKDPYDLIRTMNEDMVKVDDWLQISKLSLNLNKTHFILFRRKRARLSSSVDLIIDSAKIGMIERTKFFGDKMDQNLSFQRHINYIKEKVSRGIGILYKSRHYFSFETMRILYSAFIYPYLISRKYAHTAPLFRELKLLNIKEIYIYCVQLFMCKYHHSILPSFFSDFYVRTNSIH